VGRYSEYDRASMSIGWRIFVWTVVILVAGGLLTWGVLVIKAASAPVRGELDKQIQINDGKNQIASQELFQQLYAAVLKHDKNLNVMGAAVKRNPSSFNQTNYDGTLIACNNAVEDYDAETEKISSAKWRSPDLPYKIDTTDPLTDCQPSKENKP
jgi:hypothetical protein